LVLKNFYPKDIKKFEYFYPKNINMKMVLLFPEDEIKAENKRIKFLPLWKWLLTQT